MSYSPQNGQVPTYATGRATLKQLIVKFDGAFRTYQRVAIGQMGTFHPGGHFVVTAVPASRDALLLHKAESLIECRGESPLGRSQS